MLKTNKIEKLGWVLGGREMMEFQKYVNNPIKTFSYNFFFVFFFAGLQIFQQNIYKYQNVYT